MKYKKLSIIRYTLLIVLVISAFTIPHISQAQILPACTATGNCGICDFLDTFINLIQWALGIVAGATLVLMVWHGFTWISSGGSKEKVDSGRKGLVNTVIGMLIILVAWQLVNIVIVILVNPPGGASQNLFKGQQAWHEYCSTGSICQGKEVGSPCGDGKGKFCKPSTDGLICGVGSTSIIVAGVSGTITANSACEFWAKYPPAAMGGTNPYDGFDCHNKNECDTNLNLGTAYCVAEGTSCCIKRPSTAETQPQ